MRFPKKFQKLLEIELKDVEVPDYVWLAYAVCACEKDSCGWGGWVVESVFKKDNKKHPNPTGDKVLPFDTGQICPMCGKNTFITGALIRLIPSENQTPILIEGKDYESSPFEYDE